MSGDGGRMANPGWRGRVEDIRFGAAECARLRRGGFDRAALLDLAAEIRPLYGSGPVPPEYAPFHAAHERVVAAAPAALGGRAASNDLTSGVLPVLVAGKPSRRVPRRIDIRVPPGEERS